MFDPIYTESKQCQDCYKCIRECSVKSIGFEGADKAFVIQDACVFCGHCTLVCPVKAKKVRSDLPRVKQWINQGKKVVAAIAPSIVSDFSDTPYKRLLMAVSKLGFGEIAEVSSGALSVTKAVHQHLKETSNPYTISTSCPSATYLIERYYPHLIPYLTPLLSPALATAKEIKEQLKDENVHVVFIGPCVSKIKEADLSNGLLDAAISYVDLKNWFTEMGIAPSQEEELEEVLLSPSGTGRLYPLDGGMSEALRDLGQDNSVEMLSFSGMHRIKYVLDGIGRAAAPKKKVFLELLSCEGGCLNGPLSSKEISLVDRMMEQKSRAKDKTQLLKSKISIHSDVNLKQRYAPFIATQNKFHEIDIKEALYKIGKEKPTDELNCSGCGYESCREFAKAMVHHLAHPSMCVSYMRKLATNKANALIKVMPSGVVIVDDELRILETNDRFLELLDEETKTIASVRGTIAGAYLHKMFTFHHLFLLVLSNNEEILGKEIEFNGHVLRISIFPIEKGRVVGAIFQDITEPSVQREQIIKKAEEVIQKHLTTVQQIAYLLGSNAADSEILLNSIIKSFGPKERG